MRRRDALLTGLAIAVAATARAATPPGTPPAVLELFTSQGCSSCPPADALLGRLARQPGLIALAWHVDYWNGLGWHDPYSSPAATQRQQRYAEALRDNVYTPALVVNGARMVVGSDDLAVQAAIAAVGGFAVPVTLRPNTEASRTEAKDPVARAAHAWIAEIGTAGQPVTALLASYDPQRATQVGAGENGGRRLTDYRIVRDVVSLGTWDGAARELTLPAIANGLHAALLVQSADLKMLGAAEVPPA
jgi:hypothetical protein